MADEDFSVVARITADIHNFENGMRTAQNSANSLSDTFKGLQSLINKAFAFTGITIGIKSVVNFGTKSVKAFDEANKQLKILNNTVKVTGASTWTTTENLVSMAKEFSKETDYTESEIQDLQSVLLGFKNITGETFTEATNAVMDMATVMGMDLKSAVQTVGKALDNPIKGLDSLTRQGFIFSEEEKERLKTLVETGNQLEAQKIILEELSTTYGNAAREGRSGFSKLNDSLISLKETIGGKIMPAVEGFANILTKVVNKINESLEKTGQLKKQMDNLNALAEGRAGDYTSAIGLQTQNVIEAKNELETVKRYNQLILIEKKNRTAEEKRELKELETFMLLYLRQFQDGTKTEQELIQAGIADKQRAYDKEYQLLQTLIAQKKEARERELKEQAEREVQAQKEEEERESQARENRLNALREAFDKEIAEYKREIELRRQTGESIDDEKYKTELLTTARNAYVKMIMASNGEMKEDAERLQIIINLMAELSRETKDLNEETSKGLDVDIWRDFQKAIKETQEEIEKMATDWTPFFKDTFKQFGEIGKQTFESIGEALAGNVEAWNNFGVKVLEIIAQILEALAAQLSALAVAKAMAYSYGEAAAAAAGAAAALVSAGVLKGVASSIKQTSDAVKECNGNLQKLAELLQNIITQGSRGGTSTLASSFKQTQEAIKTAQSNLDMYTQSMEKAKELYLYTYSKAEAPKLSYSVHKAWENYVNNLTLYNAAIKQLDEAMSTWNRTLWQTENNLRATNEATLAEISTLSKLYSEYTTVSGAEIYGNILNNTKKVYSDLSDVGAQIGEKIIEGVEKGVEQSDFMDEMKSYIRSTMLKLAVYTQQFNEKLSDATSGLLKGLTSGDDSLIEQSKNAIEGLYNSAIETSKVVEKTIDSIFTNISTKTAKSAKNVKQTLNEILENGFTDISSTLKSYSVLSKGINSLYLEMQGAEQNYYAESSRLTNARKAELQSQVNALSDTLKTQQAEYDKLYKDYTDFWAVAFYKSDINLAIYAETQIKPAFDEIGESIANTKSSIASLNNEIATTYVVSYSALDAWKKAEQQYNQALNALNTSMQQLSDSLKKQNEELDEQILLYKQLFTLNLGTSKSAVLQTQLKGLKQQFYSFFEDLQNMAANVGENLVNSLVNGMGQADFMGQMKDYLRKMVIQTVVYTDAMQQEIAAIGQSISKGIAEGFSETGLHEIKRDLSYIFDQANKAVDKVDSMFNTVFSGYATGTQNATRGLHLVGEAGPELVRFRGGEQVLNANNTQKALSGSGTTINQNVTFNNLNDTSAYAMMQQFKRYNREMAINGIF